MFEAFISPLFSSDGLGILFALVTLETVLSADNLGVGVRLMCKVIAPELIPPQWMMLTFIVTLFIWGFSRRVTPEVPETSEIWISTLQPNPAKLTNLID